MREYLTFAAAGQEYGIDILSVREVRGWSIETPLPVCPVAVRGIINLLVGGRAAVAETPPLAP